eukprot:PhF_6_TR6172/c0_g1_i1/m.9216
MPRDRHLLAQRFGDVSPVSDNRHTREYYHNTEWYDQQPIQLHHHSVGAIVDVDDIPVQCTIQNTVTTDATSGSSGEGLLHRYHYLYNEKRWSRRYLPKLY